MISLHAFRKIQTNNKIQTRLTSTIPLHQTTTTTKLTPTEKKSSNQNSFQKKTPNQFVAPQQQIMKNISLYFFFPLSVHHIHFFSYENQTTHKHEIKTKTEIPHK